MFQRDKMPEQRVEDLRNKLLGICPEINEITDDFLQANIDIETSYVQRFFLQNYYVICSYNLLIFFSKVN